MCCMRVHARARRIGEKNMSERVLVCVRLMRAYNNPKNIREREKEPVKELNKRKERKKERTLTCG